LSLGFYYAPGCSVKFTELEARLQALEQLTKEARQLLAQLPRSVAEALALPQVGDWWRNLFHLAWHFERPFLHARRVRLLSEDGGPPGRIEEACVQMWGARTRRDFFPGLMYSELEHDVCTCSEAAIDLILEKLRMPPVRSAIQGPEGLAWRPSRESLMAFRQLRARFAAAADWPGPDGLVTKLLKFADSFSTPPATEWAALECGGCVERWFLLSRLNEHQELCQIRGPATEAFCELAKDAGRQLPSDRFPDRPVLFDVVGHNRAGIPIGRCLPTPVMDRGPEARWLAFVFNTLKENEHPDLQIRWETPQGPHGHGMATLTCELFAASVLAIDLAGLAPAAVEPSVIIPNEAPAARDGFALPAGYFDEIRRLEDGWYGQIVAKNLGRVIGSSQWDSNLALLREIDGRYGIASNDSRVYSIAAYRAEREQLERQWEATCVARNWTNLAPESSEFAESFHAQARHWARMDDCRARHFPGMNHGTIDSLPKLWASVTLDTLPAVELLGNINLSDLNHRPAACLEVVREVYSQMHSLKIPWAPAPPYPALTTTEAIDELHRIAGRLESEETGTTTQRVSLDEVAPI
jgi:hypothetical protein